MIFRRQLFKCEVGHVTRIPVGNKIWFQLPTTCECGRPFVASRGVWVREAAVLRFLKIHNAPRTDSFGEADGCREDS
jgi:hypothetical protein